MFASMNLKEKVLQSGRSVTYLARKVGISRPLMSMYVNDARPIPDRVLDLVTPLIASEPEPKYGK